jgi:hypothetical protein
VGVTRGEIVEAELDRLIEKRSAPEDPEAKGRIGVGVTTSARIPGPLTRS